MFLEPLDSMQRLIRYGLVPLLIGTVVTGLSAVIGARLSPPATEVWYLIPPAEGSSIVGLPLDAPDLTAPRASHGGRHSPTAPSGLGYTHVYFADRGGCPSHLLFGFPFRCVSCPMVSGPGGCRIATVRPLWAGVSGNAAIYGASTALLLGTFRLGRRRHRIRRGLCPTCAYPLQSSTCPECGVSIAHLNQPA